MPLPIRIADVMSSPVRTTSPDTTAAEAAARCHDEGIGSLVVVETPVEEAVAVEALA